MKEYVIKKGNHISGVHFGFTTADSVAYEARFDSSCLYKLNGADAYDINKLCGFSTSYSHHYQSARVGWRCTDEEHIEILSYTYANGARDTVDTILAVVLPEQPLSILIEALPDCYRYTVNGKKVEKPRGKDKRLLCKVKYLLFPYFGGNRVAPHTMKIYVRRIS